jgi:arylsulfatase A-like enzyme
VLLLGAGTCAWAGFTYGGLRFRSPTSSRPADWITEPQSFDGSLVRRPVNVVLISIDTLRADHLGCYGYGPPTSPQLDEFCRDAVVFENAVAQAASTLSSHASIFTSTLPSHHGALWSTRTALSPKATTIAEILGAQGYEAIGFHGGGMVAEELGVGQGFDPYVEIKGPFRKVVGAAVEWLDERPPRPFFLFLHTYEVHHPYAPDPKILELFEEGYAGSLPDKMTVEHLRRINGRAEPPLEIDEADLDHIIATYDAEIRSMDDALGRFFAALKQRGLFDDALVIFTSDHGEEFNEHGAVGWHAHTLYDELLKIPLVIKLPGAEQAGRRVGSVVRSLDLAPTVLEVLGLPPHPLFEGTSTLLLLDGDAPPRVAVSQNDKKYDPPISALRTSDWKLYEDRLFWRVYRARLFDLRSDPAETRNVLAFNPGEGRRLAARLRQIESLRATISEGQAELSAESVRRLKSLGYVE